MNDEKELVYNYIKNDDIYILGEFDDTVSQNIIALLPQILEIKSNQKDPILNIYINSPGGNCNILFSLTYFIERAKQLGIKVFTHVIGDAFSSGSYIAVQGNRRFMNRYSHQLMHFGSIHTYTETPKQLERNNKLIKDHFDNLIEIYNKNTKLNKTQIKQFMNDNNCYLSAEECLKYGLIDEII